MNKLKTSFVLLFATMLTIHSFGQQKEAFAIPLADFQGLYTMTMNGQEFFLEIKAAQETLILIQKWDKKQVTFDRLGHLEFKSPIPPFSLEFRMNKEGKISEVFVFGKDRWTLVGTK